MSDWPPCESGRSAERDEADYEGDYTGDNHNRACLCGPGRWLDVMSRDLSAPEQRRLMLDSVRDYLEQLAEEGLEGLPLTTPRTAAPSPGAVGVKPAASAARPSAPDRASARAAAASSPDSTPPPSSELLSRYPGLKETASLEALSAFIGDCKRCKLAPLRTHLVFGVGNPRRRPDVRRRGAGRRRGHARRAVRRPRRPAADRHHRARDGARARRRLYLQRHQVPPARQSQSRARRGRRVRAVPRCARSTRCARA